MTRAVLITGSILWGLLAIVEIITESPTRHHSVQMGTIFWIGWRLFDAINAHDEKAVDNNQLVG